MRKIKKLLSVGIISSLLFLIGSDFSYAENVANEKTVLIDATFHTCEEVVTLKGRVHYVENLTPDHDGGYHVLLKWNYLNVKGTGVTSGTPYVLTSRDQLVLNIKAGETVTATFNNHAISLGKAPDFLVHGTYHVTIDAEGNLKTEVSHLKASCIEL
ncbi:hypothetical protein [Bacillus sp. 03113]|uniref:hypothetical protein n=1 Tax=Bacillus sp. 03113 TaxID=2578211 RepID=UPI001142948F|nr:hypothetical protein [Bacillus sp. 03113]